MGQRSATHHIQVAADKTFRWTTLFFGAERED